MRFSVIQLAMAVWVLWRLIAPMRARSGTKIALGGLVMASALFSTVTTLFFGGLLSPELPSPVLVVGNFAEAVVLFLAALTFCREAVILITVLAGRSGERAHDAVQKDRRAVLAIGAASVGLAAAGVAEGVGVPEVRRHVAKIPNLPDALEGFEFVQLSDIHCSALLTEPWTAALVERVNALNPALVLITGDFVDGTVERRERDVAPLANLRATYGVWGCEGNHEQYGDHDAWIRKIESLGVKLLMNAHAVIDVKTPKGEGKLCLVGLCDPMAERFGREMPDVKKAFRDAPEPEAALRILMAHQPKYFPDYRRIEPFALQLSGHTHGGQIYGMDQMVAIMNNTYLRGFYSEPDGTQLYVHPGSGLWNGFPIRLGIPSEIALIRLERA